MSGVGFLIFKDKTEDVREFADLVLGGVKLRLGSTRVAHGVDLADEFKDLTEGPGGVEVVIHIFNEAFLDGSDLRVEGVNDSLLGDLGLRIRGLQAGFHAVDSLLGLAEGIFIEEDRVAVGGIQNQVSERIRAVLREEFLDGDDVADGLGHLLVAEAEHTVMDPVAGEGLAGEAFALGDLVLMVREDQVVAAAMNINRVAEEMMVHRGAFNMPTRAAGAPGAVPRGLAGFDGLPQREVEGVFLAVIDFLAVTGAHIVRVASGELAVAGILADAEIDIAVERISVAFVDEALDDFDNLADFLRGARVEGGGFDVQVLHVLLEVIDVAFRELEGIDAHFIGAADDLVIHVGEVHGVLNIIAAVFEVPADNVEHHSGHRVADMSFVVDSRAADIHLDLSRFKRLQRFLLASQRIIQLNTHLLTPSSFSCRANIILPAAVCKIFVTTTSTS